MSTESPPPAAPAGRPRRSSRRLRFSLALLLTSLLAVSVLLAFFRPWTVVDRRWCVVCGLTQQTERIETYGLASERVREIEHPYGAFLRQAGQAHLHDWWKPYPVAFLGPPPGGLGGPVQPIPPTEAEKAEQEETARRQAGWWTAETSEFFRHLVAVDRSNALALSWLLSGTRGASTGVIPKNGGSFQVDHPAWRAHVETRMARWRATGTVPSSFADLLPPGMDPEQWNAEIECCRARAPELEWIRGQVLRR